MFRSLPRTCVFALGILSVNAAAQTVVYVDDDAPLGGDGANWPSAYRYLQDALTVSPAGSVIRVAGGVYRPDQDETGNFTSGDRSATLWFAGVTLLGGYSGLDDPPNADERNTERNRTILSGDLAGNDAPGFTNRAENSYHVVTFGPADTSGVIDGVTVTGGNADGSDPHDAGGAIYIAGATAMIHDVQLTGNQAMRGGAIHNASGELSLIGCVLTGNEAASWGGAIDNFSASAILVNCVLVGNRTAGEGGAIHSDLSSVTVTNCTIAHNVAGNRGGGLFNYVGVQLILTNDIVWANRDSIGTSEAAQIFSNPSNTVDVNHTDVMGWSGSFGGVGNIGDDTLFARNPNPGGDGEWNGVDDDYGDVRLRSGSGCIDAGDNDADVDAVVPGVQPLPATDLAGDPRIVGGVVDMGAFETIDGVPSIPTVSAWGLAILALIVLCSGSVLACRRRPPAMRQHQKASRA